MKKYILLILVLLSINTVKAQLVVTDPGNTAQGIINAANTASTVKQITDQVSKLQKTLDYVEKVSNTVRNVTQYKNLIDRQNKLNNECLATLKTAKELNLSNASSITSSLQGVVSNNSSIISMTSQIMKSDLKMNDSERLEQLENCSKEIKEEEIRLAKVKQLISHTQTIDANLKGFKRK